jgi:hypothetical protein
MEQEKENRELAIEGGDGSDDSNDADKRTGGLFGNKGGVRASQQKANGTTGDFFGGGNNRRGDNVSITASGGVPPKRVQSRGRVQGLMPP